jgi:long-chain acyl-CoA synthetase
MNVIDFLKNSAEKYPTKIAIIDDKTSITFDELFQRVQDFSNSISFLNKKKMISLIADNSIKFVISYLGIINSNKTVHLVSSEISEKELLSQLQTSNSEVIVYNEFTKNKIPKYKLIKVPFLEYEKISLESKNKIDESKNNELVYLIYTSGTTSKPKGVAISHSMIEFTTKNIVKVLGYSHSDIDVLPLPLHHSFGLGCLHTSLYIGSTLVLLKNAMDLSNILRSLKKFKATTLAVIPATLTKFLKLDKNILNSYFSDIRLIITNSTSIPKKTVNDFKIILQNGRLATYYGLTEASRSTFMIFDENNKREESVGKTAPGVEIKIVNKKQDDSIGEIWIKGNNVIKNYWNNLEADKNLADEWLQTGDRGYFDIEGYLFLKGRNDDVINIGGEKVIPSEVEEVIKQIPGIEDVVIFGLDHEIFGQIIKLNVVIEKNSDLDKSHILRHCIKNLERHKIPSKIEFVERIPKTDYGKVKRFMLK